MSHREETLTVRGRQVRLWRGGTGRPLLYLHDTFSYAWRPVHEHLAAHGEVLMPILPGCDGSSGLEDMDSMEDMVLHMLDVCAALRLDRPVVLGVSLGGWLAAEWAMRYPDMLAGLILVDALGLRVPGAPATDILRLEPAQMRAALFADPHLAVAAEIVPDAPTPEALPAMLQARQTLARFAWQFPDNPRLARYLYRVTTPTLLVWGEQDGVVSTAHARAYQQGIVGAECVVLPQCGHLPPVEQPVAFVSTILAYLSRLGR